MNHHEREESMMTELKQITLMLNADEAEFLAQALEIHADKYAGRISFVEELDRYVRSTLQTKFDPAFAEDVE